MRTGGARFFLATSLLALAVSAQGGETVTYSYDALGRLTATTSSGSVNNGATSTIGYDAAGNRSVYAVSVAGAPNFSVSDAEALEGAGLVFTVVKNGTGAASVSYTTANGSAGAGGDYHGASGGLSFAAGESSKTVTVATIDDSSDEPSETLSLNLSGPSAGSTIADGQGIGTIFDNDEPSTPPAPPPPAFSVSDASATEGGIIHFTVTKTGATTGSFGVEYTTTNGTAAGSWDQNNPGDYYRTTANINFAPTETSKTISIQTVEDSLDESNETLFLDLTGATGGATISDSRGIGTIVDDDDPPPVPPGNTPPTPVNDVGSQPACATRYYDVLANDTDPDGHYPLELVASSNPAFPLVGGAIQVESSIISSGDYTTYTVKDSGNATATATLTVNLTGGNCSNDD